MTWEDELKVKYMKQFHLMDWKSNSDWVPTIQTFEWFKLEITSLLKKQREICAMELFKKTERYEGDMVSEMDMIRNAPEPVK